MSHLLTHDITILDKCLTLSITYLKREGHLLANSNVKCKVGWYKQRYKCLEAEIDLSVKMRITHGFVQLRYNVGSRSFSYGIKIVSKTSNIGRGRIFYFECAFTGKLCQNLYLINGLFVHRTCFPRCYYAAQTYSRNLRDISKCFELIHGYSLIEREYHKPYFKTHYKGKTTKAVQRLVLKRERLHEYCNEDYWKRLAAM